MCLGPSMWARSCECQSTREHFLVQKKIIWISLQHGARHHGHGHGQCSMDGMVQDHLMKVTMRASKHEVGQPC